MARLIVVIDPRLNAGQLTQIPIEGADQGPISREAEERAIEQAVERQSRTRHRFPAFSSVEEAVRSSRQKTAAEPAPVLPKRDASPIVAGSGAPKRARPRPEPAPPTASEPSPGRRVPLGEFLRQRLGPIGGEGPGDLRQHLADLERQRRHDPAGVSRLLEGLRAPLFPLPGAQRVGIGRLTDAEPVYRQFERTIVPSFGPRPGELVTPRENEVLGEIYRILDLHRDLEERGGVEPRISL